MKNDFELIIHKLSTELEYINLYPISDVHIGAEECNYKYFDKYLEAIESDKNGYIVLLGDMLNNGLKSSKSNVYNERMRPREQKEYLYKRLLPLKDRILGIVDGNHCRRSAKEVDNSPLYDVACRLGIEHLYREYIAFIKVNIGKRPDKQRQISYTIALHHGGSKTKRDKFTMCIDGLDIWLSGHTHLFEYTKPSKIVIDTSNETIKYRVFKSMVVDSFLNYGEYAVEKMYMPQIKNSMQILTLSGKSKKIDIHDNDF